MRFIGNDNEINLKTKHPEFLEWQWIEIDEITNFVVDFKFEIYQIIKNKVKEILN
jgi:hypothetical protein